MDVRKLFSTQVEQDPDPSAVQAAMADFLFDRMQTGIGVFDVDLRLRHFNDAWDKFTDRYAPLSGTSVERGMSLYALFDADTEGLTERIAQVLRGEVVRWEGLRLSRDGIISHWDVVLNPLVDGSEVLGFIMAIVDASDRVFANQLLTEKEAQYRNIFEATSDGLIIYDVSGNIVEANPAACQMHGYRYDEMIGLNGVAIIEESHRERFRHAQHTADFRDETAVQTINIRKDGSRFDVEVLVTRLNYRGQPHLLSVVRDVTERVQNYRLLEQRVEERTRELSDRRREAEQRRQVAEGLRDVLTILNSDRSLDEILDYIVMQTGRLLDTDAVAIFQIDRDDEDTLKIQMARGLADSQVRGFRIPIGQGTLGKAVHERRPFTVADLPSALPTFDLMQDPVQRALMIELASEYHALLAAPLYIKDEPYGGLVLYFHHAHAFTDEEIQIVVSLGDQTALAIENDRLRDQAGQTAVAAERSRLARELHDAVTQTLFSASLIAEVLPRLWQRDQAEAFRRLADLRELTRGALAEMRMLLLELRPATLTEVELGDLVRQLGEAMMGRSRIPIRTEITVQGRLRPDVQIAFYRIAQETLNNIFKHAAAHEVHVRLVNQGDQVELSIEDDGRGFDPSRVTAEHLGLHIMRERAESVGASFDLHSEPGKGTRLDVRWRKNSRG